MYRRSQRWMLIINNRFLSLYDYNFLLLSQKIFSVKSQNSHYLYKKRLFQGTVWISFWSRTVHGFLFSQPLFVFLFLRLAVNPWKVILARFSTLLWRGYLDRPAHWSSTGNEITAMWRAYLHRGGPPMVSFPSLRTEDQPPVPSSFLEGRKRDQTHGGCPMSGPKVAKFLDR